MPADAHLEYLRFELALTEKRLAIGRMLAEGDSARLEAARLYGPEAMATIAYLSARSSVIQAETLKINKRNRDTWKQLIAEHLARTGQNKDEADASMAGALARAGDA